MALGCTEAFKLTRNTKNRCTVCSTDNASRPPRFAPSGFFCIWPCAQGSRIEPPEHGTELCEAEQGWRCQCSAHGTCFCNRSPWPRTPCSRIPSSGSSLSSGEVPVLVAGISFFSSVVTLPWAGITVLNSNCQATSV